MIHNVTRHAQMQPHLHKLTRLPNVIHPKCELNQLVVDHLGLCLANLINVLRTDKKDELKREMG